MGDRTFVTLTIKESDKAKVDTILRANNLEPDELNDLDGLIEYGFDDVNYADLTIESTLQYAQIEFDKAWYRGGEFNAGEEMCRVESGIAVIKTFYEESVLGMVPLSEVEDALNTGTLAQKVAMWKKQHTVEPLFNLVDKKVNTL